MKQALPEGISLKTIEIWFQDESRIGQQGSITRTWFVKGKRPRLLRQQQFLNVYIFSAACPEKDKASAFISPVCNKDAMQAHLDIISTEVEGHAVIVLDGAGWHSAKSLNIPANITLLPLPPYSPELNPKENFWQKLKNDYLANRVFDSLDSLIAACQNAWLDLTAAEGTVRSICSRNWAVL